MAYSFTDPKKASEAGRKSRRGSAKRSQEWELLREAILTKHVKRFNKVLDELPPEAFIRAFLDVLRYFKPKLQSVTVEPVPPPQEPRPYGYMELEQMSIAELENELKQLKDDNQETSPDTGNFPPER